MSGFTQQAFEKKLNELNSSQQSIQTLSLWLMHHRKHYKTIVQTWFKELKKTKSTKRLTFMYLANDVIQNSKKKGPEFSREFLEVLKSSFEYVSKNTDASILKAFNHILNVWEERAIYDKNHIDSFKKALQLSNQETQTNSQNQASGSSNSLVASNINVKPHRKRENEDSQGNDVHHNSSKKFLVDVDTKPSSGMISKIGSRVISTVVDMEKYEKIEPENLMRAFKELENSAFFDQEARQKILNFPLEIFNVKQIEEILNNKEKSAENYKSIVKEAQSILASFNTKLAKELEDRKKLSIMLAYFIEGQRRALTQAEQSLNEYRDKLRKVISVREELSSHLRNLPDLSRMPSVAPLPSALDLFKL